MVTNSLQPPHIHPPSSSSSSAPQSCQWGRHEPDPQISDLITSHRDEGLCCLFPSNSKTIKNAAELFWKRVTSQLGYCYFLFIISLSHHHDKGGDDDDEEEHQQSSSAATGAQRWNSALIQDRAHTNTHTHTLALELIITGGQRGKLWERKMGAKGRGWSAKKNSGGRC